MIRTQLLLLALLAPACGPGTPAAPEPGADPIGPPESPESPDATGPGEPKPEGDPAPSDPAPASTAPSAATGEAPPPAPEAVGGGVAARELDEGELTWIEETYRGKDKLRTRRQVQRLAEGIQNHGPYTRWYENGVVAEEGLFEHGLKTGLWTGRFDTGQMQSEVEYAAGEIHGLKREWSDIGYIKKETRFEHGLRHGSYTTWTMMYEGQRTVHTQGFHEQGLKTGEWSVNYADGKPRERGRYERDLKEGPWSTWYIGGTLMQEAEYEAGQWHGRVAVFNELGNPLSEGVYEHGQPEGLHLEFHPVGSVKSERHYVGGRLNGTAHTYYPRGQPKSEGGFVGGVRQGPWTYWESSGEINEESTGTYVDGERVSGRADGD